MCAATHLHPRVCRSPTPSSRRATLLPLCVVQKALYTNEPFTYILECGVRSVAFCTATGVVGTSARREKGSGVPCVRGAATLTHLRRELSAHALYTWRRQQAVDFVIISPHRANLSPCTPVQCGSPLISEAKQQSSSVPEVIAHRESASKMPPSVRCRCLMMLPTLPNAKSWLPSQHVNSANS